MDELIHDVGRIGNLTPMLRRCVADNQSSTTAADDGQQLTEMATDKSMKETGQPCAPLTDSMGFYLSSNGRSVTDAAKSEVDLVAMAAQLKRKADDMQWKQKMVRYLHSKIFTGDVSAGVECCLVRM